MTKIPSKKSHIRRATWKAKNEMKVWKKVNWRTPWRNLINWTTNCWSDKNSGSKPPQFRLRLNSNPRLQLIECLMTRPITINCSKAGKSRSKLRSRMKMTMQVPGVHLKAPNEQCLRENRLIRRWRLIHRKNGFRLKLAWGPLLMLMKAKRNLRKGNIFLIRISVSVCIIYLNETFPYWQKIPNLVRKIDIFSWYF